MATKIPKIAGCIGNVTRRNVLSVTAGAIVSSGAVLLPQGIVQARMPELEQIAQALHKAVGRYSDKYVPFFDVPPRATSRQNSLDFAMENLRDCSVDQIQDLLKPLFEAVNDDIDAAHTLLTGG